MTWDRTGLQVFASPYLLARGSAPASYSHPKDGVAPFPAFPLWKADGVTASADLRETAYYEGGYTVCLDSSGGHSDGIRLPTYEKDFAYNEDFTFEFWFKYLGARTAHMLRAGQSGYDSFQMTYSTSLLANYGLTFEIQMRMYNEARDDYDHLYIYTTKDNVEDGTGLLVVGKTYHVVYRKQGLTLLPIYVNALPLTNDPSWTNDTVAKNYDMDNFGNGEYPITFGTWSSVEGSDPVDPEGMHFYSGALYNRALSIEEIQTNYALGPDYGGLALYNNNGVVTIGRAANNRLMRGRRYKRIIGSSWSKRRRDNQR